MSKKYSKEHEWISTNDNAAALVGISDYAQKQLGDIVYIDLPEIGKQMTKGDEVAVVESVKAASEIYVPVDGEVVEVNEALNDDPSLINQDPENKAWMFKIKITDPSQLDALMDEQDYQNFIGH
jgi:glycine cleavage system H protein